MKNKFPYRYRVMILIFTLILVTYIDRVNISLVGVRIKEAFHLNNEQFGWVIGAFALAYALFEIPAGVLGDRFGQKKVLIRIVLWWSVFTALTGLTFGFYSLLLVRFLFGAGEAGAFPNSTGIISRWLPANETSKGAASMMIGTSVGSAVAPLIIVPLAAAYGWRTPFFVAAAIGLLWLAVCGLWFRNHPSQMKGISKAEVDLIEATRKYTTHQSSVKLRDYFRQKNIWLLMCSAFSAQWSLYFFIMWMPVYLQQGRHFSESEMKFTSSTLFCFGIIGGILGGVINDWLAKKRGVKIARRLVGTICLSMMAILFIVVASTSSNSMAILGLLACYCFMPAYGITSFSSCVDIGDDKACTVAGIVNFAANIGGFIFSIVFGKIADLTKSYDAPLYFSASVLFLGTICWLNFSAAKKASSVPKKLEKPEDSLIAWPANC